MIDLLKRGFSKARRVYHYRHNVLSRTACLGQDVFNLKYNQVTVAKKLINLQKVRGDLFSDLMAGKNRPNAKIVEPFMARKDIFPMIAEQERFDWLNVKSSADFILIDSFSELTDQKFVHKKDGWSFCCNYTDIDHSNEFESLFECHGLIDIDSLEQVYTDFFTALNFYYPRKKVVFIHFPTVLDTREKFRDRGKRILEILPAIATRNKKVKNIFVDDTEVLPYPGDEFPYHYAKETQLSFLSQWK